MSPETKFNLGLACLLGSVSLYCTATIAKSSRELQESRRGLKEMHARMRALGMDPDVPTLRAVAELQAQERPGWHPLERLSTRRTIRTWKRNL